MKLIGNTVYNDIGQEVTHLTEQQTEKLVMQWLEDTGIETPTDLWPHSKQVKRDNSVMGRYLTDKLMACLPNNQNIECGHLQPENIQRVYEMVGDDLGGRRLVMLYCCSMNFSVASQELGLKENTLRKWFYRFRARLRREGAPDSLIELMLVS